MKGLYSTCGWCLCSQPWIFLSISGSCSTACAAATTHWELLRAACTCHGSFPFHSLHYCHPLWFWWPSHEPPVGFWGPGVADGHTSATPGSTEITQQNFLLSLIHQWSPHRRSSCGKDQKTNGSSREKILSVISVIWPFQCGFFPCQTWIFQSLMGIWVMVGKAVPLPSQQEMSTTIEKKYIFCKDKFADRYLTFFFFKIMISFASR